MCPGREKEKKPLTWVVADVTKTPYSQQNCLPLRVWLNFKRFLRIQHYSVDKVAGCFRSQGQTGSKDHASKDDAAQESGWGREGGRSLSIWLNNRLLTWQQWGKCFPQNRPPTYSGLYCWLWIQVNRPGLCLLYTIWDVSWIFLTAWTP